MMAITEMIFTDSILQATNGLKSEEMVFGLNQGIEHQRLY